LPADGGMTAKGLAQAHARLLSDHSLQFVFSQPPATPNFPTPEWLKAIGRWISEAAKVLAPYAVWIFWIGVGLALLAVLYLIARDTLGSRLPFRKRRSARVKPADWRPEALKARALLADADRLAEQGRYDEAAHLLLFRSIDDIDERRPRLVRPALTARDISRLDAVPPAARSAFARIAAIVERSLFGGHVLDAAAFSDCRAAYEMFAFGESWR
jgi:hypothetical protein